MKHSPGGWAEIAQAAEKRGDWQGAATAWMGAKGASIGFNRRDRYERSYDRCMAKHEEHNDYAEVAECPDCTGRMEWCSSCQVWTQTCCEDYGTCECS